MKQKFYSQNHCHYLFWTKCHIPWQKSTLFCQIGLLKYIFFDTSDQSNTPITSEFEAQFPTCRLIRKWHDTLYKQPHRIHNPLGKPLVSHPSLPILLYSHKKSEKEGFEPSRQITPPNTLAGCRLQPLGHFSLAFIILTQKNQFYQEKKLNYKKLTKKSYKILQE